MLEHDASPSTQPETERTLVVLYGSETGTAEDYAHELGRAAERLRFDTRVIAMNDLDIQLLSQLPLVVFVTSTTGQGDMPANMSSFWRFLLRKRLPPNLLSGMWFTSFGCGDSTYVKFNYAVKKLHKRILQLGGREVCARGEGDEQHSEGIDGAFFPWSANLMQVLVEKYPLPEGIEPIPDSQLLPAKYILEFDDENASFAVASYSDIHIPRPNAQIATVHQNIRVTPQAHFQDVRHITFVTEEPISYSPGDVLSLSPQNLPKDVNEFIALQNWESIADRPLKVSPTPYLLSLTRTSKLPLPPSPIKHPVSPLTLRSLLTHHLDITAIPRRSFFSYIANYTDDARHKERLLEFIAPENIDELWDYTTRPRRTIIEVLQEFGSVKLDWRTGLLGAGGEIAFIRERLFSIASSQKGGHLVLSSTASSKELYVNGTSHVENAGYISSPSSAHLPVYKSVEILVAIVKYQTILKKPRTGLCTRWLTTLTPGSRVNVLVIPNAGGSGFSSSAISAELDRPVVMIGPGTGVAPLRSLAWERLGLGQIEGRKVGDMLLFFGCRNQDADYFFHKEWEQWENHTEQSEGNDNQEGGELCCRRKVYTAFSRDQKQKRYVQHVIREQAEEVHRLLHDKNGIVYVCGSSGRMPQAVREALIEVFQGPGGMDRDAAEAYLVGMERTGRYRQETW
ncbi:electron transfer flavoprotein beta-subunit [Kalaharituber pfeilii]|nr:electron transfer flavoprotein beta-subunit [Kalaharituber pfeilii]